MGIFSTIRPSSLHASTYTSMPEDMDDWTCTMWKEYYQKNKSIIGKSSALLLIEKDSERVGSFADIQMCKYDCAFVDYFAKEGLKAGNIFSKLYCTGENVVDVVGNVTKNAGGLVSFITSPFVLLTLGGTGAYMWWKDKKRK